MKNNKASHFFNIIEKHKWTLQKQEKLLPDRQK